MSAQDRSFRRASDEAYKMELRKKHATGKFKTVAGSDPVAVEVQAHIEFTRDAAGHEGRLRGHPVDRVSLLKLLEFVVARGYRLGWEMVAERKRHGRPVQRAEIDGLFNVPPAWMVSGNGVPQRVGTGAHSRKPRVGAQPALVEAAAEHFNMSKERVGDLARQLADMAGNTPWGMIGKFLNVPKPEEGAN